jgi:hypothetical protein
MMGIPPSEADRLDLRTYEALLFHWNEAHASGDDIDPPDPAFALPLLDRINADPRLTH